MKITSSVFTEGSLIPQKYSCDGKDISPPLSFDDIPQNAQSLVLIADDPDAPVGTWVHWVYYNISTDIKHLNENIAKMEKPDVGGIQGKNSWGRIGYGGPCPPGGTHRYFFKLYALDQMLALKSGATKSEVLKSMAGHVLAETQIMGKFKR